MAHNQTNGALNGAPVSQENSLAPRVQETGSSLKDRLAGIAHERHEKLKAEILKAIDAYESRSETEYLIDEYIQTLSGKKALERENAKLKTSYTDLHSIKESQSKQLLHFQNVVNHQHQQLLNYQQIFQEHSHPQHPQQLPQPSQQPLQLQQLQLQPLQEQQNDASEPSISQLQGDLDMTIAELTRAMEDVDMYKKKVESLEHTNQDLQTQLDTKHSVNHELGQILEGKIKEHSKHQAEQNKNKAEVKLATSLGSLKGYQLYSAVAVISEYYDLLAPLMESKSKEALKDLEYVKDLNLGMPPSNIPPGMLDHYMTSLRRQIYLESQVLQRAILEVSSFSSSSSHLEDTSPQHDPTTSVWRIEPSMSVPGSSSSSQEPPRPQPKKRGPKKKPPTRIVAANQIAPGVQRSGVKAAQKKLPSQSTSKPSENSPTEPPPLKTPTLPIVTPPVQTPSSTLTTPISTPLAVTPTMPLPPNTSTAMLLQMHKQRMQEQQQGLNVSTIPPSIVTSPHASSGRAQEPIVIPHKDLTVSEATTPTQEDIRRVEVEGSTPNSEPGEANTLATITHLEGSGVLDKFRAMDMKQPERGSFANEQGGIENVSKPTAATTTTTYSSSDSLFAADMRQILFPSMAQTTFAKARQSPGYVSPGKKRQVDHSPTRVSLSSSLSVAKRPKLPPFELSTSFGKETTKSLSSYPGFRREKGRWYLEAVEVPLWKGKQEEENE
ncbi:MAG: hypothetical protein BYD32DRAFT_461691 [Podila humilis]|nr:MAG: hypothetical protein BYD32DRAFT_461691 [Podila humilis]